MKNTQTLGINLLRQSRAPNHSDPEPVGCMAQITDWDRIIAGGFQITARGIQRYFAETMTRDKSGMLVAKALPVAAEACLPLPEKHQVCADILKMLVAHLGKERFAPPFAFEDAVWVSYRLAEFLPLKRSARQNMLEMNDTLTRLEILHGFLIQQGLQM